MIDEYTRTKRMDGLISKFSNDCQTLFATLVDIRNECRQLAEVCESLQKTNHDLNAIAEKKIDKRRRLKMYLKKMVTIKGQERTLKKEPKRRKKR